MQEADVAHRDVLREFPRRARIGFRLEVFLGIRHRLNRLVGVHPFALQFCPTSSAINLALSAVMLLLFGRHKGRFLRSSSSRELPVLDAVRLVGMRAEAALAVGFVVLEVALEPHTWLSPSNARMCVAMRSRNQRSWLMTTAQPAKLSSASSSARRVSTSRSLVGSSSNRRLPPRISFARWTRLRSPPDRCRPWLLLALP